MAKQCNTCHHIKKIITIFKRKENLRKVPSLQFRDAWKICCGNMATAGAYSQVFVWYLGDTVPCRK